MHEVMRPLLAVLGAALLALVLAPAAHALPRQGSCTLQPGSPPCLVWTGKVTWISDGDTVDVDVDGDGTRTPVTVRLIGIQAMEQSRYSAVASRRRGDCHAVAATDRLEKLLRRSHMRVRLAAQDPDAKSFGRPWRNGIVNVAIGVAGLEALVDLRGQADASGRIMHSTIVAVADELASAADLAGGKVEQRPVVLVRGYAWQAAVGSAGALVMDSQRDLFP